MQVKLEGELTLARVSETKPLLLQAVNGGGDVAIDVSALTEVDVAGLQLLCATHRQLDHEKRNLAIVGKLDVLRAASARAAFKGDAACLPTCIWRKIHG